MRLVSAVLALAAIEALAASGTSAAPRAVDPFLVPVKAEGSGFGPYRERPGFPAVVRLTNAFGTPSSTTAGPNNTCRLRWNDLGIKVLLATFGQPADACSEGVFIVAGLTDERWHTPSGVHPGSRARKARRAPNAKCSRRRCVLGKHFSDCAASKVPSVTAKLRKKRVVSLVVFSRGCE